MTKTTNASRITEVTREERLELLKEHPHWIKYLSTQDEESCKVALESNPRTICLIREQTEELCLFAIEQNSEVFCYIRNRTEKVIKRALELDERNLYYLDQQDFNRMSQQELVSPCKRCNSF